MTETMIERYAGFIDFLQILYWQIEGINQIRLTSDIVNNKAAYNQWSGSIRQLAIELAPFYDTKWNRRTEQRSEAKRQTDIDIEYFNEMLKDCILLMHRKNLIIAVDRRGYAPTVRPPE